MSPASTRLPAVSPDGKLFAYADSVVTLRSAETGQDLAILGEHTDRAILGVDFSPDSLMLADTSDDQVIRVWDLRTKQERNVIRGGPGRVNALAIGPENRLLVIGFDDGAAHVWDLESEQLKKVIHAHNIVDGLMCLDLSPDGRHVATGSTNEGTVRILDIQTGKEKMMFDAQMPGVIKLRFNPKGDRLAVASELVRLFDISNGGMIGEFGSENSLADSLVFSRDGRRFAAYFRNGAVRIYDVPTAKELLRLSGSQAVAAFVRLVNWVQPMSED
jgi:WD40 repeat protein